ncbi:Band 7 protein [Beggiatoa sp. PS]|nr:Band 7 protein [Beggiatoa sp. PS]
MDISNNYILLMLICLGMVMIMLFMAVKSVPQGQEWTVERFGKYLRTLDPGLHIIIPAIDIIGKKLNMMEQTIDIFDRYTITKDNATVHVDGIIFYQVVNAAQAAYQIKNFDYALRKLAMTNL